LAYFKQLIALRRRHPALRSGSTQTHLLDEAEQLWLVERRAGDDAVLIAVNLSNDAQTVKLPWSQAVDQSGAPMIGTLRLPAISVSFFIEV
jgi:glycosidase